MPKDLTIQATSTGRLDELTQEALDRLADCRAQKDSVQWAIREAYWFTRPRLSRRVRTDTAPEKPITDEDAEVLATGVGSEVSADFATEIMNAFFPPTKWAQSGAVSGVPLEQWEAMRPVAEKQDDAIFVEINASNLRATLGKALNPEGGVGTVALWIDSPYDSNPIHVRHVPIRKLELNVGPDGEVDDRFVVEWCRARDLPGILPGVALPTKYVELIRTKPKTWVAVTWGFWRKWDQPRDTVWQSVVMIDKKVVAASEEKGEGSCPLVVMRWAPDDLHAFGNGPTLDAAPELRVHDHLTLSQENRAIESVNPPLAYDDDGVLGAALEEKGIEAGKLYPRVPGGDRNSFENLAFTGDVDLGLVTMEDLRRSIRRKHFADYPEQPGKTPPTATQWVDEVVKAQRRLGTPGEAFFAEGPAAIFTRFRRLCVERGFIQPLMQDGREVSTMPINPATQAQAQQDVQVAIRVLEIIGAFFPQLKEMLIDPVATVKAIQEKLGDKLVKLKSEEDVQKLVQGAMAQAPQIMQMLGGGAAPPGGGAPAAQ